MANTHVTQRMQVERFELDYPDGTRLLSARSARASASFLVLATILLIALVWASVAVVQTW
jgi:hypothetical protein